MTIEKFAVAPLISKSGTKSNTKKLSEILDQVELAIANGVSYAGIVQALADQGIMEISVPAFRLALHRIRQRRQRTNNRDSLLAHSAADVPITASPRIISKESAEKAASPNVKMTLQEIKEQAPHQSPRDHRARYADQYIQDNVHPRIKNLLEKSK